VKSITRRDLRQFGPPAPGTVRGRADTDDPASGAVAPGGRPVPRRAGVEATPGAGALQLAIVLCVYSGLIALAEALLVFLGVVPGIVAHAILLVVLLNHHLRGAAGAEEPAAGSSGTAPLRPHALPILALLPLLRLVGLLMLAAGIPLLYRHALIGVPVLLAALLTIGLLGISPKRLGLAPTLAPAQLVLAASGVPLGLIAYAILRPPPLAPGLDWRDLAAGAVILGLLAGLGEELIFRGLLQRVAGEVFGGAGIVWSSGMAGIMYLGSLSPAYVLFMVALGTLFGWAVRRGGSLWGVIVAHGLLNVGLFMIWPTIWG
jgi:uncharacterized protein